MAPTVSDTNLLWPGSVFKPCPRFWTESEEATATFLSSTTSAPDRGTRTGAATAFRALYLYQVRDSNCTPSGRYIAIRRAVGGARAANTQRIEAEERDRRRCLAHARGDMRGNLSGTRLLRLAMATGPTRKAHAPLRTNWPNVDSASTRCAMVATHRLVVATTSTTCTTVHHSYRHWYTGI